MRLFTTKVCQYSTFTTLTSSTESAVDLYTLNNSQRITPANLVECKKSLFHCSIVLQHMFFKLFENFWRFNFFHCLSSRIYLNENQLALTELIRQKKSCLVESFVSKKKTNRPSQLHNRLVTNSYKV